MVNTSFIEEYSSPAQLVMEFFLLAMCKAVNANPRAIAKMNFKADADGINPFEVGTYDFIPPKSRRIVKHQKTTF